MRNPITVDEQMLVSAVRYALGRSTYITSWTAEAVAKAWPDLTLNARAIILRDVQDALDAAAAAGKTVGMDMDHRAWVGLLESVARGTTAGEPAEDDEPLGPDEGYPGEEELQRLLAFRGTARELVEYTQSLWRNGAGCDVEEYTDRWGKGRFKASFVTGGWSGCEAVIGALNSTIATMHATEWHRGGLWVFEFPETVWDGKPIDWAMPAFGDVEAHPAIAEARDRVAHLESVVADHDAYLTSMLGVKHPDPAEDCFVDASFDLHSRLHPRPAAHQAVQSSRLHPDAAAERAVL